MSNELSEAKSEILDAAAKCFMAMGSDVASIDDVAHSLGATKGRIYHHFSSKGALTSAVRIRATMFTLDAVKPVIDSQKTPSENFHAMAYTHVLTVLETLPYHKVVLQHSGLKTAKSTTAHERDLLTEIHTLRGQYEDLFRTVLKAGMQQQEFRQQNLSIALHGVLLLLNSSVFWYIPRDKEPKAICHDVAKQLANMALAALN